MRAPNHELLKAVKLALAGEWEAAHDLVQRFDNDPTAEWIHAVLHKLEGDQFNSRYWYQRANQMSHVADEPQMELAVIQAAIELLCKLTKRPNRMGTEMRDFPVAGIHTVLHKIEGDDANSRYWYRRADCMAHAADEPRAELAAIRDELRS